MRADGGARVLVVNARTHGHRTFAAALTAGFERRGIPFDQIEVERALWNRIVGYTISRARGADFEAVRRQFALDVQLHSIARSAMARYDVVHVMPSGFAHPFARLAPSSTARLSIGTDCTAELMRDELASNAWQEALRHRADRTTFENAHHVVCLSDWARDSVLEHYDRDPALTAVVPPSAPVPATRRARDHRRRPRIAMVGAPWRRKGGDRLVEWFRQGRLGDAELHFLSRDAPDAVRAIPGIRLHEPMERHRVVAEFLPSCDLFVMPTRRDQSPWVLAEAAAAGLPIVASRMGSIPELVLDGVTGYVPEPGDDAAFCTSITRLVDDARLRDSMGTAAHAHAASHLDEERNFDALAVELVALASG